MAEWFPEIDANLLSQMKTYHDELHKFNRTLNLVSAKTLPFADAIHFSDCYQGVKLVLAAEKSFPEIYDLGSGNGFPGLIFAMMSPSTKVVLVDADQKKCEFFKHIASTCALTNVVISNTAIESFPANSIKVCMSRGFSTISKMILLTRKCVAPGGIYFHFKGEAWANEVGEIPTQLCSVWAPGLVGEYKLPIGPYKFAVVRTDKIA